MRPWYARPLFWIMLLAAVAVFYYLRTWFHWPVMLFYTRPVLIQALVLWLVLHVFLFRRWKKEKSFTYKDQTGNTHQSTFKFKWLSYCAVLPVLFGLAFIPASVLPQLKLVDELEYNAIDKLPEAEEDIRLIPYEVAKRYARDSLQLSQFRLGTESIAMVDDRLAWVFPLVPDGLIIKFTLQNKGMTFVDATVQERNSQMVWQDMAIGEGMQITDNLWWNLYRHRYFVNTEKPYYIPGENEIYTVVPAISYTHHFRWGIWYTVPRFAGLFVVTTDGKVELLEPSEAKDHPALQENKIFPAELTRYYVQAYQYLHGIINRFFIHEDQIQIQDIGVDNRQPFLMNTTEGLKWFVSTEPYGASHGIFKIFLVDAVTGEIELFELPGDQVLTGPVRASDYVRQSNPVVDWSRFTMAEPLPFVRSGVLFWKVAVIPEDAAGIAYQAFVDSRTNRVMELRDDDDIKHFIVGDITGLPEAPEEDMDDKIERILKKIAELEDLVQDLTTP